MAIDRGPWNALVDDDGSNLVGSVWNKAAIKTVILDPVEAAIPSTAPATWTAYTPVWAGPAGPTLGSGILQGHYYRVGTWIDLAIVLQFGASTTPGSGGYWTWSLPFVPRFYFAGADQELSFRVGITDQAGSAQPPAIGYSYAGNLYAIAANGAPIGPTTPFVWQNGCRLSIRGSYETAT